MIYNFDLATFIMYNVKNLGNVVYLKLNLRFYYSIEDLLPLW